MSLRGNALAKDKDLQSAIKSRGKYFSLESIWSIMCTSYNKFIQHNALPTIDAYLKELEDLREAKIKSELLMQEVKEIGQASLSSLQIRLDTLEVCESIALRMSKVRDLKCH